MAIIHLEYDGYWFKIEDDYQIPKRSNFFNISVSLDCKELFRKNFRIKKSKISLITTEDIIQTFDRALNLNSNLANSLKSQDKSTEWMKKICRSEKIKKILN